MTHALIYTRVSTAEQAETRNGLDAQRDACAVFATREGWETSHYTDAGISGGAPIDKRAGLVDLLADLKRGDVVLVAKRDRLGRDFMVIAMIEAAVKRAGARIVSAAGEGTDSDDPSAILFRRMVDAFAEYERGILKARTKAALRAKRLRGERTGTVRYGYRLADDGKHLEPDPAEQAILSRLRALRGEGLSYRAIAKRLNAERVPARGQRWIYTGVEKILKNAEAA